MAVKNKELLPRSADSSDKTIQKMRAEQKDVYIHDSAVTGLVLRVTPSGKRLWHLRYSTQVGSCQWVSRKHSLGAFDDGLKTRAARELAEAWRVRIRQGEDPQEEKTRVAEERKQAEIREIAAQKAMKTLGDAANAYAIKLANKQSGHTDGGKHVMSILNNHLLSRYGDMPIKAFRREHIFDVVDPILARGNNVMANAVLTNTKSMFQYAIKREFIKYSVLDCLAKKDVGGPDKIRERVLCATKFKHDELRELFIILPNAGLALNQQIAIHILLGTACRGIELFKARWDQIDFDKREWIIPSENAKNDDPIAVFLSDYSLYWFKQLREVTGYSDWMFPGRSIKRPYMLPKVLSKAVGERQLSPDVPPRKGRTRDHSTLILPGGRWTVHDLRRTASTEMQMLGISPHIIDACQNHRPPGSVQRRYQHGEDTEKMHMAWDLLGRSLTSMCRASPVSVLMAQVDGISKPIDNEHRSVMCECAATFI